MYKKIILSLALLFTYTYLLSQAQYSEDDPPNREPGKCYAKCLITDKYKSWEKLYPIYLGEYNDSLDFIEEIELVIHPAYYNYIKHSPNQNIPEYVPEEIFELLIVIDTSKTQDYTWETFEGNELLKKGGYTEWREVLCNSELNVRLRHQIQKALESKGFYTGPIKNIISWEVQNAIKQFQIFNDLAVGSITVEFLDLLGINY